MPTFPMGDIQRAEAFGAGASSRGTAVTANATANTKGTSFTTLIASTSFHASWIWINFDNQASGDFLVDIAVGAASSETIILENLLSTNGAITISYNGGYLFPVNIPAGSRISARCQCHIGGSSLNVAGVLFGGGMANPETFGIVTTYGANTADSGGVSVDPGGTLNTKSSYSQITASTTYPIRWLVLAIGVGQNIVRTSCTWRIDIAIGPATETVLIPDLVANCHQTPDVITPMTYCFPVNIPAGTRISVRASCSIIDAADRLFDAVVYGVS